MTVIELRYDFIEQYFCFNIFCRNFYYIFSRFWYQPENPCNDEWSEALKMHLQVRISLIRYLIAYEVLLTKSFGAYAQFQCMHASLSRASFRLPVSGRSVLHSLFSRFLSLSPCLSLVSIQESSRMETRSLSPGARGRRFRGESYD